MRNTLIFAAVGGLALIAPVASWAAETSSEVPLYDPYETYSLVFVNVSTPWVGTVNGPDVVVAQIPEPGSFILVLTGLGLLAYSTRRRKRS